MSLATGLARALVGLMQGLALFLLYRMPTVKGWPATEPMLFAPLLASAMFLPPIVVAGLSTLRPVTLAIWTVAAVALSCSVKTQEVRILDLRLSLTRQIC